MSINSVSTLYALDSQPSEKAALPIDPYEAFWHLAYEGYENLYEIIDIIEAVCGIEFDEENINTEIAKLKLLLSEEELKRIIIVLEWSSLLFLGHLPKSRDFESLRKFAGIETCIDLLIPSKDPFRGESKWSTDEMCAFILNPEKDLIREGMAQDILNKIADLLEEKLTAGPLLQAIDDAFEFKDRKFINKFEDVFFDLPLELRFRWCLFSSAAGFHSKKNAALFSPTPGRWPSTITASLIPLIQEIERSLFPGSDKVKRKKRLSGAAPFMPQFIPPPPIRDVCKVRYPELPNWMPNGGNSCYISSSLWGLCSVLGREMQQNFEHFQRVGTESVLPAEVKKARENLFLLYKEVAASARKSISSSKVNSFRQSMQIAFPWHFLAPRTPSQEDAFEFLTAVMRDLLGLNSCARQAPKFLKLHTFSRIDEEPLKNPENYDYQEAFNPSARREPLPLVDIRLEEPTLDCQTLKSLVTDCRNAGVMERNAYRRSQETEGPKYYSVNANHFEQLVVESRELAPDYFICRLGRFSSNHQQGNRHKRFDAVLPNATLEFSIQDKAEESVPYDLAAISVHQGATLESGHYYSYLRKQVEGAWKFFKYDDLTGISACEDILKVLEDAALNGYIFFYIKREKDAPPPLELPFEKEIDSLGVFPETPSSQESGKSALPNKRNREEFEEGSEGLEGPKLKRPKEEPASSAQPDLSQAVEWIIGNLSADFSSKITLRGFSTLEELLFACFRIEVNPLKFTDPSSKGRELLAAVSIALEKPIYLIDPERDAELAIPEASYPYPGDLFRFGEKLNGSPLYIFRQANGAYVWIRNEGGESV